LTENVIPDLRSENKYLRERAILCIGKFSRLAFSDEVNFKIAETMVSLLKDEELPIQVAAATSVYLYLRKDKIKSIFAEHLSTLLESYLHVMELIDHEELVSALEDIVGQFAE